jgi:hypothetical protein
MMLLTNRRAVVDVVSAILPELALEDMMSVNGGQVAKHAMFIARENLFAKLIASQ